MGCSGLGAAYSFGLSDKFRPIRLPGVRFFAVIGQARATSLAGCPILCGYRTSSDRFACWLSDSLRLSDKLGRSRLPDVRFFAVIGQARAVSLAGCLILCGYRTSSDRFACWVSDSLRLSDKLGPIRLLVVRFFAVIGQARTDSLAGCPILYGYRTSSDRFACWVSDSLRLSDKLGRIRLSGFRFFAILSGLR